MTHADQIICVPLDGFPEDCALNLVQGLSQAFDRQVVLQPGLQVGSDALDPIRGQINSTAILLRLQEIVPESGDRLLGLISADLFIPIFTFVFGEAQLSGPAAVVSGFRLRNEFYGLEPDRDLYYQRLLKECIHELGHTYGLHHCRSSGCVMVKSTYVENIDLKGAEFCSACNQYLKMNRID